MLQYRLPALSQLQTTLSYWLGGPHIVHEKNENEWKSTKPILSILHVLKFTVWDLYVADLCRGFHPQKCNR